MSTREGKGRRKRKDYKGRIVRSAAPAQAAQRITDNEEDPASRLTSSRDTSLQLVLMSFSGNNGHHYVQTLFFPPLFSALFMGAISQEGHFPSKDAFSWHTFNLR